MNARHSRWVACYDRRPNAAYRVICFPHAGGSTTAFATWHRELPPEIELCVLALPGKDDRRNEAFRLDMKELVAELLDALSPLHDRGVALFGYSLGALVAFEYARAVRAMGAGEPEHLFVAARKAPQLPADPSIFGLSDADFLDEMVRRYEGIPKLILEDPALLGHFLPAIRGDVALLESHAYQPEPPLTCPITALAGERDPNVDRAALEAWSVQTTGRFVAQPMPGGHFFIAEARAAVLKLIADSLLARKRQSDTPM
jgi:medium-chain acyl-[acyl-carrier-protein] hydrolase